MMQRGFVVTEGRASALLIFVLVLGSVVVIVVFVVDVV
jgi:hypothetical protein